MLVLMIASLLLVLLAVLAAVKLPPIGATAPVDVREVLCLNLELTVSIPHPCLLVTGLLLERLDLVFQR